jgi:FKBP-type peptidyl-prolyl cis-trans isomerase SlpA
MSDTAQPDSLITLNYRVATGAGDELISTFDSTPAVLQLGSGELAPTLERCLIGVAVGEHHIFVLEPEQAFGSHNPQLVQRIGLTDLPPTPQPELHGLLEFASPAGAKFTGIVRELDAEAVLVDFNHPLAGKQVRFEVELIGIL